MARETDVTREHRRAEDPLERDFFGWVSALLTRYKILFYIVAAFFVAAGFGFKTPDQRFDELDDSHLKDIQALEARVIRLELLAPLIETNAVIACLSITEREAQQYRLPCRRLLDGRGGVSDAP
jgi:hypothetical protein